MAITREQIDQRLYAARYKGASTVLASTTLPIEKQASRLEQFAQRTDNAVSTRTKVRQKFAKTFVDNLKSAGYKFANAK